MSSPTPPAGSFLNGPLVNTITGYFAYYQEQDYFSKERLQSLRHYVLITIGFLVLLYCLIHIQILFFWLLKFIFRSIFKIISMIFWLPLRSVRFFIPKSIDYDILFPLFWLCSISSFYISKFSHENICRFYDQRLASRHPIFNYDRTKREEFKRYLFVATFSILLLLQALFILLPIALSIRHQHQTPIQVSSTPATVTKQTTTSTIRNPTAKSAVNDVVETFTGNLYKRFIDAFSDENELQRNEKRAPLVSDEKLEDTFKTIQKTIQNEVKKLKTSKESVVEPKKSSRFQRWIVHYLKAPFQKWEGRKKAEEVNSGIQQKEFEEEENTELESSSSLLNADESDDDDDEEESSESDDEQEEPLSVTDRVVSLGANLKEKLKSKISSSKDEDSDEEDSESDEEDDDDTDDEEDTPSLKERLSKPVETVRKIGEQAAKKLSSSSDSDDEEEEESDDEESQPTTASDKIKEQLLKPIEKVKDIAEQVGDQLRTKVSSSDESDEESGYESDEEEEERSSKLTETIDKVKNVASSIKEKITSSTDTENSDSDSDSDDDEESTTTIKERLSKPIETVQNVAANIKDKIIPSTEKEDEDSDDDDEEESASIVDRIEERLSKPIETVKSAATTIKEKITSSTDTEDEDSDREEDTDNDEQSSSTISQDKITSSSDTEDDDSDSDEEKTASLTDQIKDRLSQPVEAVKSAAANIKDKITSSSDEDDDDSSDEESVSIAERLSKPLETVQTVATSIKDKITSSTDTDDDDDDDDEESDTEATPVTEQIKERLSKPVETVKGFGEKILDNVRNKFSSSANANADDSDAETDEENEEEEHPTILDRVKENVVKPIEVAATNLRDKLPPPLENDEDLSFIDRTKKSAEKVKDQIAANADELKHKASDLVHSVEDLASNAYEKSSEYVKNKAEQLKKNLPKLKRNKPVETKATKVKKFVSSKAKQLKDSVVNKLKSLKKKKKPKTLTEKAKDKFKSLSKSLRDKLPGQKKKKEKSNRVKASELIDNVKSKFRVSNKLNGWLDDAWNIWHLTQSKLSHVFSSSTKHARHLPRHNTTSLYVAFTDLNCYHPTKKLSRYRLSKLRHSQLLDMYRRHSPFPVYLSVLKSNGPKCYRKYPDSSCGFTSKSATRGFASQVYRFVRFWAIVGLLIVLLGYLYKKFTHGKQPSPSSFQPPKDSDRSSNKQQATTVSTKSDVPRTVTTQKVSSNPQQTISSSSNTEPLNEQVAQQLRLWLEREQNDGFRNLSETCRAAINSTFVKHLERLSVETLQFVHARIRNVAQNKNQNKNVDVPTEKIIINAVLDIDHLILNIVNTFKEQHFSFDTPKLSGQLHALLVINPNRYTIEASLQQLKISPANIIDPNNSLSVEEKQSFGKLLDETVTRTVVRCSFHLSDNQENASYNTLQNSSPTPYPDTNKTYSSSNQLSTTSTQSTTNRSRQPTPNRYQPLEPPPKLLVNDSDPYAYTNQSPLDNEPRKLLVRIVKAVKLHDVEQPYCILELNHPEQTQKTSIAKNGLNPFWDERFLFECDDQSNQIHLQIIDRKTPNKRAGNTYVDTVYADVSIPFSYATSTVYKQDIQISPQNPESIIRIEFSTLSEEEALAANNGYDIESITDSQTWTYNEREANKIEHDYPQRYQQSLSNDYLSSSYDNNPLPSHYGLSTSLYDDDRAYSSTIPRSGELHSTTQPFSPSLPATARDDAFGGGKPKKSKSFMSSLKHLTLPRRKHADKDKHNHSMSSQASSNSQLNTSIHLTQTNPVSHSLSSAVSGPRSDVFLANTTDPTPMRRSRSISQSFKNLFRSSSKKKGSAAKADALGEYENVDNRTYLSTSTPTSKKLSFLARRKSKQKAKQQTNLSTNSLSSYDCSRIESVRDTPVRANVGHPVTMTKSLVR